VETKSVSFLVLAGVDGGRRQLEEQEKISTKGGFFRGYARLLLLGLGQKNILTHGRIFNK